jgi:hypothetical protein
MVEAVAAVVVVVQTGAAEALPVPVWVRAAMVVLVLPASLVGVPLAPP